MSVQFGRWNIDGTPVERAYLENVKSVIAAYGPDGDGCYTSGGISMLYRALHTTKEARREAQPHTTESGTVITWDGRLDNREEIISQFCDSLTSGSTDVSLVAAAYKAWGTGCFAKLIGDWALSIWDADSRSLILVKDPIGTRHLYYFADKNEVTWSTDLEPLVLFARRSFALNEEYVAGWFSFFPSAHLTPYVGINSVPPSSYALIRPGSCVVRKYWDFDPGKKIRYHTDAEYEEHFRTVFTESVRRRLRSESPVLADLSGGMDSSAIVCMADILIARGSAETPRLDTVSYYDDSEPTWNERPYFVKVEEKRGRRGHHINAAPDQIYTFGYESDRIAATPASHVRQTEAANRYAACVKLHGSRVVLSGLGGDEVMGGVPTPMAELEDLIATAQFKRLVYQLKLWALNKRRPWFQLFMDAIRRFLPMDLVGIAKHKHPAAWLLPQFVKRNRRALGGYERRARLFGSLPSFQENISTLEVLRRQLACHVLPSEPFYVKRYPYLDRTLLEFMFAVPREQVVRPGERRSLMRRALTGIVPAEILQRKRKAYVVRSSMTSVSVEWASLIRQSQNLISSSLGIVDHSSLSTAFKELQGGHEVPLILLQRTLAIEAWLRHQFATNLAVERKSPAVQGAVRQPKDSVLLD